MVKQEKKPQEIEISFAARGYVKQNIVLLERCQLTPEQIIDGINKGTIVTTIQEHGRLEILSTGEVLGHIQSIDNELEYSDYELKFAR